MGKKRRMIAHPQKFGTKHAAHPAMKTETATTVTPIVKVETPTPAVVEETTTTTTTPVVEKPAATTTRTTTKKTATKKKSTWSRKKAN